MIYLSNVLRDESIISQPHQVPVSFGVNGVRESSMILFFRKIAHTHNTTLYLNARKGKRRPWYVQEVYLYRKKFHSSKSLLFFFKWLWNLIRVARLETYVLLDWVYDMFHSAYMLVATAHATKYKDDSLLQIYLFRFSHFTKMLKTKIVFGTSSQDPPIFNLAFTL